ncbi:MAG: tRNA 2-selenouridine(34) synthase MnmH [Oleiphilaceae bacterium]|nr:tRNA 2-selenouridine(34) synthase MnmH [Oleiphilaceae bacterium]
MSSRPDSNDYLSLFLSDTPLMDVRAPVEFGKGSFPSAVNAPLMNDDERHQVGLCYKERGQDAAINLGHQLVSGNIRASRLEAWRQFTAQNPDGYLFCFRGGLRSRLTQQWLYEAGIDFPLISGGYKAMRRYLIEQLDAQAEAQSFMVLSGRTGTGKTRLLLDLPKPVDLEGLANHRGSSFGRQVTPQPTQIDFENRLSVGLLKAAHRHPGPTCLEDESRLIGRCYLPDTLCHRMKQAPLMVLERPLAERVRIIREDYVETMLADYCERDGLTAGWLNFRDYLLSALERISKRLGSERYGLLRTIMTAALDAQEKNGDLGGHAEWIKVLLTDYYDPMYDYQLSQKEDRIVARGSHDELEAWAEKQTSVKRPVPA